MTVFDIYLLYLAIVTMENEQELDKAIRRISLRFEPQETGTRFRPMW